MSGNVDEEEREHWWQVMRHFLHHLDFFELDLERRQKHINQLSEAHQSRLPELSFNKFGLLHNQARLNQFFFEDMVEYYAQNSFVEPPVYAIEHHGDTTTQPLLPLKDIGPGVDIGQQHRNVAVLHSLYREWSQEGQKEREQCFSPIIEQLQTHLPLNETNKFCRVSVPGCGLGRLPLEIASKGYCCEGNEFSAYMVIASNFMLNAVQQKESYEIAPWVTNICNVVKVEDTLRTVKVPDIPAVDLIDTSATSDDCPYPPFSFAAGNFVEIYSTPDNVGTWDCVVTCFFLDTAPVVVDYIDTINNMLKPGGIWINLGPLLYHWASDLENNGDSRYAMSIELSYEEVQGIIASYGFSILHEEFRECSYTRSPRTMMHTIYNVALFTAQKPK